MVYTESYFCFKITSQQCFTLSDIMANDDNRMHDYFTMLFIHILIDKGNCTINMIKAKTPSTML